MAAVIARNRNVRNKVSVIYTTEMPYTRKSTMDFLNGLTDNKCMQMFRLSRNSIFRVHEILEPLLERPTKRNRSLETIHQVCAALKFFGYGCFLNESGEGLGLEKSSLSRIIRDVSDYFSSEAGKYISFPVHGLDEIKQKFYEMAPLPNIVGAIDGTQITIKGPTHPFDESAYVNRKGGHSINCMVVCDNNMKFVALKTDSPGSEHDSCAFNYSHFHQRFQVGDLRGEGVLLGDSGYPLKTYLFTPLANPISAKDKKYNKYHKKIRCIIERAIGLLKSRFRCLDKSAGYLNFQPPRASKIIVSCVVLHNLCIDLGEPAVDIDDENLERDDQQNRVLEAYDGIEARHRVIQNLEL